MSRAGRGTGSGMSDNSDLRDEPEANEAVQAVVDRVLSYQAGAPIETVSAELARGLDEASETMPAQWVARTAERISAVDPALRAD
jgi:hypothetical protein